jgi:hypothetical protein
VVPVASGGADECVAAAVIAQAREAGLDLRRRMFVAFVIEFGPHREDAYAAERSLRGSDWSTALYGDATGWVLRLSHSRQVTRDTVAADVAEVNDVAARCHGQVRGAAIEDLHHDDVWAELAGRLHDSDRRADDARDGGALAPSRRQSRVARSGR